MAFIIGDVVNSAGRPVTGTITLTPSKGSPVEVKVRGGLIHPTPVPPGTYTVTGSVRARGDLVGTPVPTRTVTVGGARFDLSVVVPAPAAPTPATAGQLSIVEREPGVYEVTGATVTENPPGTYTLTV